MRGDDVVEPAPHLLHAAIDDRLVVLDRTTAVCHVLNASAGLILDAADGTRSVDGIVALLSEETGVDPDAIAPDVHDALDTFRASGLVLGASDDVPELPPAAVSAQLAVDEPQARRGERDGRRRCRPWSRRSSNRRPSARWRWRARPSSSVPTRRRWPPSSRSSPPHSPGPTPRRARSGCSIGAHDGPHRWRIVIDGELFASVAEADDAVSTLAAKLNLMAVAGSMGRVLLHAGAVERDGRAIVVAGESGRGKSTLTAALVQAGFNYLTDELVLIDPDTARVEPYPKALDLSEESHTLLSLGDRAGSGFKGRVSPGALGSSSEGGELSLLVLLAAPDGPGEDGVRSLAPVDALVELLRSTFAETFILPDALDTLARLCTDHAGHQPRPHAPRRRRRRRKPGPPRAKLTT